LPLEYLNILLQLNRQFWAPIHSRVVIIGVGNNNSDIRGGVHARRGHLRQQNDKVKGFGLEDV